METEEIRLYCLAKNGVTESLPFDEETLVFKVGNKIFLLISLEKMPVTFSAKADPERSEELREHYPQIAGAYHMNKTHWNSVVCEGLSVGLIKELIDHSYQLVFNALPKKVKAEIEG